MMRLNTTHAALEEHFGGEVSWLRVRDAVPPSVPHRRGARQKRHGRGLDTFDLVALAEKTRPLRCVVVAVAKPHGTSWTKLRSALDKQQPPPPSTVPSSTEQGFFMDADADDLAAMDEYDRQADERYRAGCERESRALLYERD
jgi:hypothetical protein